MIRLLKRLLGIAALEDDLRQLKLALVCKKVLTREEVRYRYLDGDVWYIRMK